MQTTVFFKKTGSFLLDLFEIYIPSVAFSIMFVVFVLQIFFRYFLNRPLTWPYEVTIFGFIWTAILGACFARRYGVHVVFGLIYDKMSPKIRLCGDKENPPFYTFSRLKFCLIASLHYFYQHDKIH